MSVRILRHSHRSQTASISASTFVSTNPSPASRMLRALVYLGTLLTVCILVGLIGYILLQGVPHLSPSLFEWNYTSDNVSLMPALISTVLMAVCALVLAVPIGVASAIYLVEYTQTDNRFVRIVRVTTETLQGIPSIIYGLFGLLFFTTMLGWGHVAVIGRVHTCYHGVARYHAHFRRSFVGSTKSVSRRWVCARCWTVAYRVSLRAA